MAQTEPSDSLIILATYVMKVCVPMWFESLGLTSKNATPVSMEAYTSLPLAIDSS